MRYPKLRELVEAIKALIKGPYTSRYPFRPHVPEKKFRGKPEYHEDGCVGCGACSEVCPAGCITLKDDLENDPPLRRLELRFDNCIFCGQCQAACITEEGIKLSNKFDLALFDRKDAVESVEKELALCEACGCIVGAKDHISWVAKKLGPLSYTSPTSYLSVLKELRLSYNKTERPEEVTRQDRMGILCPACRRKITLNT